VATRGGLIVAANKKLVGQNYTTPDLIAKVTGAAKFAEDYRVEGMLFAKLLLSRMPHARVRRLDLTAALAVPGVRAILTADDVPGAADTVTDLGKTIKADLRNERALTNEPMYYGEPVLAVAADSELIAAEAIEKIEIEWELLPFNVDPLDTLRSGRPNASTDGNVWAPGTPPPNGPPPAPHVKEVKWTEEDFADVNDGHLPMGKATDEWSYGDLEGGFRKAALVLDDTFVTPNTYHQTLESRTAMAYWQNGKVFLHCSTQSVIQTVDAVARWLHVEPKNVVIVSAYTGGGFGSKVTGAVSSIIPALLSRKTNRPVMMRISREEEHAIGGARPSIHGRMKVGFAKDGRVTAVDLFAVMDNGPYEQQFDVSATGLIVSLLYQPPAMHWRGMSVLTNTPPRRPQSQPGGMQGITLMERLVNKAAHKLGLDQVEIRRRNAPEGKAPLGPMDPKGQHVMHSTSCFVKQALDRGVEIFGWEARKSASGQRTGAKVRGVGASMSVFFAGSSGYDGLLVVKPDGRLYVQSGIGNHGTASVSDVHRVAAELLGVPWEKCVVAWGDTSRNLPWTCVSGGSQTTLAMTRAVHAAAMDAKKKFQEIGATRLGGHADDYDVADERVVHRANGRSMTLAQAAQAAIELGGKYDGHEVPKDINAMTKESAMALASQGLMGVARDSYPMDGTPFSFVASFAEVEVDVETGKFNILDYLAVVDVGTVMHPHSLGGQVLGRSMLGIGHAIGQKTVYDQHYGVPLATRFYQNKPPTILDAPAKMQWAALDIPDPETPVGARGIGEPPVAAGCNAVLNALANAVGDEVFRRAPVMASEILASLEAGHPAGEPLTAHI
jgi:xanthine dehydrogenase molybdenum-binding subunit